MLNVIIEDDKTETLEINGREYSEQTVNAALKAYFVGEPEDGRKPVIRVFGEEGAEEGAEEDIYLKLEQKGNDINNDINVNVVNKDGDCVDILCWFDTKGLHICNGAKCVGFSTDEQGRIKVENE